MQRLIKSMTGSSPSSTSIQASITEVKSNLEKSKRYLQTCREQPQIQTFESTAKYAQQVANETARVAAAIQQYGSQHRETLNIALQQALTTQLQDAITSAQVSATRIAEGIEAARAHAYPEAIVHYTDQVKGTVDGIATLQGQLVQLMSDIRAMVDAADGDRRAIQAEQQAVKQAEHDRQVYLEQYGGIDPVEIIAQVQAGTYPSVPANVITHKGEVVLFNTGAKLSEDRTTSQHVGGSAGVSVPLGHGFRFRTGSYHGHTIHTEHLTQIDVGNLIVTTQRIVFVGGKSTFTVPVAKVLHTILYKNGVDVRAENRKKREVFLVQQPVLTNTFILIACHLLSA